MLRQPWRDLGSLEIRLAFVRQRTDPAQTTPKSCVISLFYLENAPIVSYNVYRTFGRTQVNSDISSLNGVSFVALPIWIENEQWIWCQQTCGIHTWFGPINGRWICWKVCVLKWRLEWSLRSVSSPRIPWSYCAKKVSVFIMLLQNPETTCEPLRNSLPEAPSACLQRMLLLPSAWKVLKFLSESTFQKD